MKITKLVIITHHFWPENFLINEIALKFKKKILKPLLLLDYQITQKEKFLENIKKLFQLKKRILMELI